MRTISFALAGALVLAGCTALKKMGTVMAENPTADDPATLTRGALVYRTRCVSCHGDEGRGDGPASAALDPKPADLGEIAERKGAGAIAANIRYGKNAGMPAFEGILTDTELWDVANYVDAFAPRETLQNLSER
jgi:mono/diheme cytochrome c family protein